MKKILLILVLAVMCSSVTRADDLDDGYASYNEGNYTQAMELLLPSAIQGHAVAQTIIGLMYYKGEGVIQDDKEAARWFQKASEQGNVVAQHALGLMYYEGKGVMQDDKEAEKWFQKAAEQGNADAQYNLGVMYNNGKGVIQDYKEAARWFQKAAKQGHVNAQYNLGMMYDDGKGVLRNYVRAHMWFNLAASNGHKKGSRYRERVAKKMTPSKISQAQNMAKKCEKKNYKNCK